MFEAVNRDSLFYNQFQYMTKFLLKEASALRTLDHAKIDQTLDFRTSPGIKKWLGGEITAGTRLDCHTVCDQLLQLKNPFKSVIMSPTCVYFYSSSLEDIDSLGHGPMYRFSTIAQANITRPKDTVGLNNPKHKYRTYFREQAATAQQVKNLDNFFKTNKEDLKISPGLKKFLTTDSQYRFPWITNYHYIDHNDMRLVTALALLNPRLVRKTKQIVMINN